MSTEPRMSQADRMEAELESLRAMKEQARKDEDEARQITLTKISFNLEKELCRQRIIEEKLLDAKIVDRKIAEATDLLIAVLRRHLQDEAYDACIDDLIAEFGTLWNVTHA